MIKANFAELAGATNGFPISHLSFKFSKWVAVSYFQGNQFSYFISFPREPILIFSAQGQQVNFPHNEHSWNVCYEIYFRRLFVSTLQVSSLTYYLACNHKASTLMGSTQIEKWQMGSLSFFFALYSYKELLSLVHGP